MQLWNTYIENYLRSQANKSNNDILGMNLFILKEPASYISKLLVNVINRSLESGVFEHDMMTSSNGNIFRFAGPLWG